MICNKCQCESKLSAGLISNSFYVCDFLRLRDPICMAEQEGKDHYKFVCLATWPGCLAAWRLSCLHAWLPGCVAARMNNKLNFFVAIWFSNALAARDCKNAAPALPTISAINTATNTCKFCYVSNDSMVARQAEFYFWYPPNISFQQTMGIQTRPHTQQKNMEICALQEVMSNLRLARRYGHHMFALFSNDIWTLLHHNNSPPEKQCPNMWSPCSVGSTIPKHVEQMTYPTGSDKCKSEITNWKC